MAADTAGTGGEAERVRCLYCGANNFPASAVCWQCGRPLKAASAGATPAAGPAASFAHAAPAAFPVRPAESALAPKAGAALGLLFPWIGLPVGMVFLMLDDPRKTQLGWLLIGWSVLGTVLNTLALGALVGPLLALLKGIPHPGGAAPGGLPSLPTDGADSPGMLLLRVGAALFPAFCV